MKIVWLRYLVVFVCLFSILESTGVSVISILKKTNISQNDCCQVNDDEAATEKKENKETNLKEFWTIHQDLLIPRLHINGITIDYPKEKNNHHLAWVPPVPTPPPNYTV